MIKKFPTWVLALLIVLIGSANGLAEYKHLYFYVWWLDIPMHLFGGLWVGLSILAYVFSCRYEWVKNDAVRTAFLLAVSGTFLVSIGWELFEFYVDRLDGLIRFDLIDTISDVCNGMIGAGVGTALFIWRGYNRVT